MTGITENKLSKVKSYDLNNPYQVGVNGVTNVDIDGNGEIISVSYDIDGVSYTSILNKERDKPRLAIFKEKLNKLNTSFGPNRFKGNNFILNKQKGNNFYSYSIDDNSKFKLLEKKTKLDVSTTFKVTQFNSGSLFFESLPIFKKEVYNGFIEEPKVESEVFIDRQQTGVFERHQRLEEIESVGDFDTYRNNFYNIKRI